MCPFWGEGVIGTLGWTIKWLDHCRTLKSPLNPRPSDGRKVSIEFTAKWLEMDQNIARDLTDYASNAQLRIPYPQAPIVYMGCRFEWPSSGLITVVAVLLYNTTIPMCYIALRHTDVHVGL